MSVEAGSSTSPSAGRGAVAAWPPRSSRIRSGSFAARGLDEAALGVDAENLSGALRLYESLGFRRYRTGIAYRKPL